MNHSFQSGLSLKEEFKTSYRIPFILGGWICFLFILYSFATIVIMLILGSPPETSAGVFEMLNENKFTGLLRLDILTAFIIPLYYILFYSIYLALKNVSRQTMVISTLLIFAGVTLFLATPSIFSMVHLSDKFQAATSEEERNMLLAAGEAIIASDMWHGTGPAIGGLLTQIGTFVLSIVMLKGNVFNKLTAWTGIATHGLDLGHILIGFFLPAFGVILMSVAGVLYLLWFPLIGFRLFKLAEIAGQRKQTE